MKVRLLHVLSRLEDGLLVLLIVSLLGMSCTQIVMRNVFDSGIPWLDPASRVLVLWLALVAAAIATRERQHLSIDLTQTLSASTLNITERIISLVGAAVCATIAWFSIELIQYEMEDGLLAFSIVPVWVTELIIPASFALMSLRFFLQIFGPVKEGAS